MFISSCCSPGVVLFAGVSTICLVFTIAIYSKMTKKDFTWKSTLSINIGETVMFFVIFAVLTSGNFIDIVN